MPEPIDPNDPTYGVEGTVTVEQEMEQMERRIMRPRQITVDLPSKVTYNGIDYHKLVVHQPTTSEVLFSENFLRQSQDAYATRNSQIQLLAKCARVPVPVVMRLEMSQFNEAMGYILPFFFDGLEIHGIFRPS